VKKIVEIQVNNSGSRRHSVGNWKKILSDPEFSFNERTEVDLKDKWRIIVNRKSR
jgi:hypothetical protein